MNYQGQQTMRVLLDGKKYCWNDNGMHTGKYRVAATAALNIWRNDLMLCRQFKLHTRDDKSDLPPRDSGGAQSSDGQLLAETHWYDLGCSAQICSAIVQLFMTGSYGNQKSPWEIFDTRWDLMRQPIDSHGNDMFWGSQSCLAARFFWIGTEGSLFSTPRIWFPNDR